MITKYSKLIKDTRLKRGVSQADVASKLAISRPSYISIEKGKRELTVSEFDKLTSFLNISHDELRRGQVPDYKKYREMILAFLRIEASISKSKLAKLLYFADFAWFYYNLESMSGMQYRKMQYGPVADSYFAIIDEMFENGEINIKQTEEWSVLISQTRSGAKTVLESLSKKEIKLIKDISKKWSGAKTYEIVNFTRKQFPYLYARENEVVSYNLFTQENPDDIF